MRRSRTAGTTRLRALVAAAVLLPALAGCGTSEAPVVVKSTSTPVAQSTPTTGTTTATRAQPAVTAWTVEGRPVSDGASIKVKGKESARKVAGRLTAPIPAGQRVFVITTPLQSKVGWPDESYVQGHLRPAADGSWSITVHVAQDGVYYQYPDQVTVVMVTPDVARTMESFEGVPGKLKSIPSLAMTSLGAVYIVKTR